MNTVFYCDACGSGIGSEGKRTLVNIQGGENFDLCHSCAVRLTGILTREEWAKSSQAGGGK